MISLRTRLTFDPLGAINDANDVISQPIARLISRMIVNLLRNIHPRIYINSNYRSLTRTHAAVHVLHLVNDRFIEITLLPHKVAVTVLVLLSSGSIGGSSSTGSSIISSNSIVLLVYMTTTITTTTTTTNTISNIIVVNKMASVILIGY